MEKYLGFYDISKRIVFSFYTKLGPNLVHLFLGIHLYSCWFVCLCMSVGL